jgi:AcrR family transcriptional regulator
MTARRPRLDEEQVVAAAATLADEQGLEAVTLSRVARELGVQPPSLYNHVDSLDALMRLLSLRSGTLLGNSLADAVAGRAGPEAVAAAAHAYRAFSKEHPGLYPTTIRAPRPEDGAHAAAGERVLTLLMATLHAWDLSNDERIDAIRGFRAAVHGFVVVEAGGGYMMDRSHDLSFDALIATLIAGLDALHA